MDDPDVLRVGGREYHLGPDMSIDEFHEAAQMLERENEKFVDLARHIGWFRGEDML